MCIIAIRTNWKTKKKPQQSRTIVRTCLNILYSVLIIRFLIRSTPIASHSPSSHIDSPSPPKETSPLPIAVLRPLSLTRILQDLEHNIGPLLLAHLGVYALGYLGCGYGRGAPWSRRGLGSVSPTPSSNHHSPLPTQGPPGRNTSTFTSLPHRHHSALHPVY
jgi:hypothetical protein